MKKNIMLTAILVLVCVLSAGNLVAKAGNLGAGVEQKAKTPPFLISGKIPHLTKLLMEQWDSSDLNLNKDQRDKLLVVRKETLSGVRRICHEIAPLEQQVATEIFAGKTPDELSTIVKKVAALKTEATMLHLQCIDKTSAILTQQQLTLLMK